MIEVEPNASAPAVPFAAVLTRGASGPVGREPARAATGPAPGAGPVAQG